MNSELSKKKKLLIINRIQFGYHTDTYYYSKFLRDQFEISYLCYDHLKEKIQLDDIKVFYVNTGGSYLVRTFRFFRTIVDELEKSKSDVIFVNYFPGVSLLSFLLNKKNTLLDIRTGSVLYSKTKRKIADRILRVESKFYKHISVISEGLANKLKLKKKVSIIPLGAEVISGKDKEFKKIDLLYVGTFYNRNIEITIDAVARFAKEVSNNITYTIVGFGSKQEEATIKNRIRKLGLENIVLFEGRVKINELTKYFNTSNIGVTFIPITDYYNHQPPTKLFEYALSGMVNIATATTINKIYINKQNGVICDDNTESFFEALCKVHKNLGHFNSKIIKESLAGYSWNSIVKNNLTPKLMELIQH